MFSASISAFLNLLLALPVLSDPVVIGSLPVTLTLIRSFNFSGSDTILKRDQTRAQALVARANNIPKSKLEGRAVISDPVSNNVINYVASVGVGSPPTTYNLVVDAGSSITWIGAAKDYVKTSTSTQTANKVSSAYGVGWFSGTEYIDQVTLAPGLVIPKQSIGVVSSSYELHVLDGILGIGPVALTSGTLDPATDQLVPTVTDNLFGQGAISANEVSISFEPTTVKAIRNGELTFGGTDSSKFTGSITYTPITNVSIASQYWGISQTVKYGTTSILTSTGIVDTGTTFILLAPASFATYKSLTGGVVDEKTGLLRLTSVQFSKLKSLFFIIGGTTFELTPNAQIWPRALNAHIGGTADGIYLIVNKLRPEVSPGEGVDFVSGCTFLERFYTVFDTTNHRVGLATTSFTKATSN